MGHVGRKRAKAVTDDDIVSTYTELRSAYKVSRRLGVAPTVVYRVLDRRGIACVGLEDRYKDSARFDAAMSRRIRALYENEQPSYAALVEQFGGTEYSIKTAIKRAGGKLVPVTPPLTEKEEGLVLTLHSQGVSQMKIARMINRSQSLVSRIFRKHDLVKLAREHHGSWKGGRWTRGDGYVYVMVEPDDPMRAMAIKNGYALEHRLVLARKLGRPLLPSETVHHIDGVRSHNAPDNLQLRQGRHGKHIVMACLDCGSHRIGPVEITED